MQYTHRVCLPRRMHSSSWQIGMLQGSTAHVSGKSPSNYAGRFYLSMPLPDRLCACSLAPVVAIARRGGIDVLDNEVSKKLTACACLHRVQPAQSMALMHLVPDGV